MAKATPRTFDGFLARLERAIPHGKRVSFGQVLDTAGRRSFGAAFLVPGLPVLTPLGGVPGVATGVGMVAFLVALQLLMGRKQMWLPSWALRRQASGTRVRRALRKMRKPAPVLDRLVRPRLRRLLRGPLLRIVAGICALTALLMPLLELIPFADTLPGAALAMFGLALIADDGAYAVAAVALCAASLGLVAAAILL